MKKPPLVEVEWFDAQSVYEQMELSRARERCHLSRRFTVGYLIAKEKDRLLIAGTFDPAELRQDPETIAEEDCADDFTVIPRGWVRAIIELKPTGDDATATG